MSILPNLPSGASAASFTKGVQVKPEEGSFYAGGRKRRAVAKEKHAPKVEINDAPVPASTDRFVRERDGNRCQGCGLAKGEKRADGSTVKEMHVDHIDPRRRGGRNDEENLRCACERCNLGKGGKAPAQWEKEQIGPVVVNEPPSPKPERSAEDLRLLAEKDAQTKALIKTVQKPKGDKT